MANGLWSARQRSLKVDLAVLGGVRVQLNCGVAAAARRCLSRRDGVLGQWWFWSKALVGAAICLDAEQMPQWEDLHHSHRTQRSTLGPDDSAPEIELRGRPRRREGSAGPGQRQESRLTGYRSTKLGRDSNVRDRTVENSASLQIFFASQLPNDNGSHRGNVLGSCHHQRHCCTIACPIEAPLQLPLVYRSKAASRLLHLPSMSQPPKAPP